MCGLRDDMRAHAASVLRQCAADIRSGDWEREGGNLAGPRTKAGALDRAAEVLLGQRASYFSAKARALSEGAE